MQPPASALGTVPPLRPLGPQSASSAPSATPPVKSAPKGMVGGLNFSPARSHDAGVVVRVCARSAQRASWTWLRSPTLVGSCTSNFNPVCAIVDQRQIP
eukprot:6175908-Pleurochrysis_carterae.AAC.2